MLRRVASGCVEARKKTRREGDFPMYLGLFHFLSVILGKFNRKIWDQMDLVRLISGLFRLIQMYPIGTRLVWMFTAGASLHDAWVKYEAGISTNRLMD
jgi:hypothetical protein